MRKVIIAGNWKMHKTGTETAGFVQEMAGKLSPGFDACEVIVGPPFTALAAAADAARGSRIQVAAQNLHWEKQGAFTGEISAGMLKDAGCSHVIIGHSERRQFFGETDETVNKRILAALDNGLIPIFCLGETLEERQANRTFDVVSIQLKGGLLKVPLNDPERLIVAYEPVWAIGTGVTATPEQAQEVHAQLRKELADLAGKDFADGGAHPVRREYEAVQCEVADWVRRHRRRARRRRVLEG